MPKYTLIFFIPAFAFFLASGCKNNSAKTPATGSDTARFFPVNYYLKGQIARVDSFATLIYKITIEDGKRDSTPISKRQFDELAQTFLTYDISDNRIHGLYKENVFQDQSTNSYTFDYTAKDSSLPLQNVTVLLDVTSQQVKRVFINTVKNYDDSTVTEKSGWKNDESFYINSVIESPRSLIKMQQNIIGWRIGK